MLTYLPSAMLDHPKNGLTQMITQPPFSVQMIKAEMPHLQTRPATLKNGSYLEELNSLNKRDRRYQSPFNRLIIAESTAHTRKRLTLIER